MTAVVGDNGLTCCPHEQYLQRYHDDPGLTRSLSPHAAATIVYRLTLHQNSVKFFTVAAVRVVGLGRDTFQDHFCWLHPGTSCARQV